MEKFFMRYKFTLISSAFYLCVLILSSCKKDTGGDPNPGGKKPNIVLILADDIGYEIPNYTGGQSYSTPLHRCAGSKWYPVLPLQCVPELLSHEG
jgi:hypothetical protein